MTTTTSPTETLDELPDRPLRQAELGYLKQSGHFEEIVTVRGAFITGGVEDLEVHQLLVVVDPERVIALNYQEEWGIVYDSDADSDADAGDVDGRYDRAHQILYDLAPVDPVDEDFFEMIVDDDPQYYKWQEPSEE